MSLRREMVNVLGDNREKPLLDVLREFCLSKQKERAEGAEQASASDTKQQLQKCKAGKRLKLKFKAGDDSNFVNVSLCDSLIPPHYVKCPISECQHSMDPIDVMAHYITQHENLKIQRIFDDGSEGFEIKFDPFNLPKYESTCLAVLAFAGKLKNEEKNKSGVGYRKFANEQLPKRQQQLKHDLPILIMASRNIVVLPSKPGDGGKRFAKNLVVVWPATLETQTTARDLYCWIMAKSPKFIEYRSTLVEMRSFEESQDPSNLLLIDNCTFHVNMNDVEQIMSRGKPLTLRIKCKLHEFKYEASGGGVSTTTKGNIKNGRISTPERDSDNESNRTYVVE